jgi:Flp pilus assembly protein CpaB
MEQVQKLISTKAGTVAVAGGAAVLAGIFIIVYLNRYRHSVKAQGAPVTVLVAKRLIPKGTSGAAAIQAGLFSRTTIRQSQLRDGAFSDAASIRGRVATTDVYTGQQLTAGDFKASAKSMATTLSGAQRVIDVPLDAAHGLISHVQPGDRVDVFVGFNVQSPNGGTAYPVDKLLAQNVVVADVAKSSSGGVAGSAANSSNVSLRVTDRQAQEIAFASDNGKVWLALRPPTGATEAPHGMVTVDTVLLGVRPIQLPSYSRDLNTAIRNKIRQALTTAGGR